MNEIINIFDDLVVRSPDPDDSWDEAINEYTWEKHGVRGQWTVVDHSVPVPGPEPDTWVVSECAVELDFPPPES